MAEEKPKRNLTTSDSGNRTLAYVLLGAGAVLLLINILDLNWWRLWPLILVAIGVYLLLGRNSIGSEVRTAHIHAPLEAAKRATMRLHLSLGEVDIRALPPGSEALIDGEIDYVGDLDFDVAGATEKTVALRLAESGNLKWLNPANWFGAMEKGLNWRLGLNAEVPTDLAIYGGLGESDIDLRSMQLDNLTLHGGVGEMEVALPATSYGYDVDLRGGVGEIDLRLPGATAINLRVKGGVGEIKIALPAGAAVQLRARGGIGDVNVPRHFVRTTREEGGLSKSGTWETPGFADADKPIVIDYEGGIGELHLRGG